MMYHDQVFFEFDLTLSLVVCFYELQLSDALQRRLGSRWKVGEVRSLDGCCVDRLLLLVGVS